jgi:hypothetical protein
MGEARKKEIYIAKYAELGNKKAEALSHLMVTVLKSV